MAFAGHLRGLEEDIDFLFSATRSGAAPHDDVQFVSIPDDTRRSARAFLDEWRPDLLIWLHGAYFPGLLAEVQARDIPRFAADVDSVAVTETGLRWVRGGRRPTLDRFDRILTVDEATAASLRRTAALRPKVDCVGALGETTGALPCNEIDREDMISQLGGRPVWLVAGLAVAEASLVSQAYRAVQRRAHRLLAALCPDNDTDPKALAVRFRAEGFSVANLADGDEIGSDIQIAVIEDADQLGLWYRLSDMTLLGGTFAAGPSRHPFEAAALGSALLYGPRVGRYRELLHRLGNGGGAARVQNGRDLAQLIEQLLAPDRAARMAHAAWDISSEGAAATNRLADLVLDHLELRAVH